MAVPGPFSLHIFGILYGSPQWLKEGQWIESSCEQFSTVSPLRVKKVVDGWVNGVCSDGRRVRIPYSGVARDWKPCAPPPEPSVAWVVDTGAIQHDPPERSPDVSNVLPFPGARRIREPV